MVPLGLPGTMVPFLSLDIGEWILVFRAHGDPFHRSNRFRPSRKSSMDTGRSQIDQINEHSILKRTTDARCL